MVYVIAEGLLSVKFNTSDPSVAGAMVATVGALSLSLIVPAEAVPEQW
jgi:hypothetical protein